MTEEDLKKLLEEKVIELNNKLVPKISELLLEAYTEGFKEGINVAARLNNSTDE